VETNPFGGSRRCDGGLKHVAHIAKQVAGQDVLSLCIVMNNLESV
jgi:hypothetical protein